MENLVGYANIDLLVPLPPGASVRDANAAALGWCAEVNGILHSETQAVPAERLELERPALRALPSLRPTIRGGEARKVHRLSTIRFGSARYSVPLALVGKSVDVTAVDGEIVVAHEDLVVARRQAVAPGEASPRDDAEETPPRLDPYPHSCARVSSPFTISFMQAIEFEARWLSNEGRRLAADALAALPRRVT